MKTFFNYILLFSLLITFGSCKKFVEINPPKTSVSGNDVFAEDAMAISAIRGVYIQMGSNFDGFASGASRSINYYSGLSADELVYYGGSTPDPEFYTNSLLPSDGYKLSLWDDPYNIIFLANTIIEGAAKSSSLSEPVKNQLTGEAKFVRAFCHFYLVNMFGDVPLVISTSYQENASLARTSVDKVYEQIIADLKDAQNLLISDYSNEKGERVRPNKWAATALLARVYLYVKDWNNAELESSKVIEKVDLYDIVDNPDSVFLRNSEEAIWQLGQVRSQYNTLNGATYIPASPTNAPDVGLTTELFNAFESGDVRKTKWVGVFSNDGVTRYYSYKYKVRDGGTPLVEYQMILRLAEQYLIRSEARAMQNKLTGANSAESDINMIRNRALLGNTTASTQEDLLTAIEQERRVELFTEWGDRWLDLKRTNRANDVLSLIKSPNWQSTDVLYPIPQQEIDRDPNLTQNEGYN